MATTTQAIERVAAITRTPVVTVDRVARVLKQHQSHGHPLGSLWPRSGQGGGSKAAHVEPQHLTNMILALAAADPITTAAEVVARYRAMVNTEVVNTSTQTSDDGAETFAHRIANPAINNRLAPAQTVGAELDGMISKLQNGTLWTEGLRREAPKQFRVDVERGSVPRVFLSWLWDRGATQVIFEDPAQPQLALTADTDPDRDGSFRCIVTIRFVVFEALAELWADTLAHYAKSGRRLPIGRATPHEVGTSAAAPTDPWDAWVNKAPETENAGTPGREPALSLDPDLDETHRSPGKNVTGPDTMRESENSQASNRGPGPSQTHEGQKPHGPPRQKRRPHPAASAAA